MTTAGVSQFFCRAAGAAHDLSMEEKPEEVR